MNTALEQLSDGELIKVFNAHHDESAFEILVRRHHDQVFGRFVKRCGNRADAEDLCQKLWVRVVGNLHSYEDEEKFDSFLATIGTNLLADYWRHKGVTDAVHSDWNDEAEHANAMEKHSDHQCIEDDAITRAAIDHLTKSLIPALPCDLRVIYLLRHESEYWEEKQPLTWTHVAELNGISVDEAWERFEATRNRLISNRDDHLINCEHLVVFLLWTQGQRPSKSKKYTEQYFAELLSIPVNTLKTRYRAAKRTLSEGLADWRAT